MPVATPMQRQAAPTMAVIIDAVATAKLIQISQYPNAAQATDPNSGKALLRLEITISYAMT